MQKSQKMFRLEDTFPPFLFLCALIARILFFRQSSVFHYDQAVFALIAKHISEFKEFPIFTPFAHYGGMFSGYIAALLFKIFGVSSLVWNALGIISSCIWVILTYILSKKLLSKTGCFAALIFVCLPPWDILFFSLFIGAYGEMLSVGMWFFLLLIRHHESINPNRVLVTTIGFVAGFGLWLTPYMAPFILTAVTLAILRQDRKKLFNELPYLLIGFCVGYLPAIIYDIQHPGAQMFRFAGRILNLDRSVLYSHNIYSAIFKKILWRISTIPQSLFRIPGMVVSLFGLFTTAIFTAGIILVWKKRYFLTNNGNEINTFGIFFIFIAWFIVFYSTLIGNSAARYMFPFAAVAPFFIGILGQAIREKSKILFGLFAALMMISGIFSIEKGIAEKNTPAYHEFANWLVQKGIQNAYADPLTAYCVQFESNEKVILSPTLIHPSFYERWPQQTELVRKTPKTVFIVNEKYYPEIASTLKNNLRRLQITYHKESFREFAIYTDFSRKVYPEELTGFENPVSPTN